MGPWNFFVVLRSWKLGGNQFSFDNIALFTVVATDN